MHSRALGEEVGQHSTHMVFFDPGEEAIEGLSKFALDEGIEVASFTAIGGFETVSIGFFNLETRGFDEIPFYEPQVEVLSLMGEITKENGEPLVHGHVVLGRRDGSTIGGHLLRGVVRPILIVTVNEWTNELRSHHHHHHG
jgi:uncharacterized protein